MQGPVAVSAEKEAERQSSYLDGFSQMARGSQGPAPLLPVLPGRAGPCVGSRRDAAMEAAGRSSNLHFNSKHNVNFC